jgi:tRNA (cytidine/uridine-2'-O-)-methyltransferase
MQDLPPHSLCLGIIRPQIPQNLGNIARTCVVTGTALHVAGPMPFAMDEARLKRSGLDYWPRLRLTMHATESDLLRHTPPGRAWLFDSSGQESLFDVAFKDGDWLVFGSETHGLPAQTLERHGGRTVRIPQVEGERCLNLATSAGIALYQALSRLKGDPGCASRVAPAL